MNLYPGRKISSMALQCLLVILFVLLNFSEARGAFVVRNNLKAIANPYSVQQVGKENTIYPDGLSFQSPRRTNWGNREARIASKLAFWGLFFWPLGIFAIIHGYRALRLQTHFKVMAFLSLFIGALEILTTLVFLFFILYGPFYTPFFILL